MDMTWNQFRRAHKGLSQKEISEKWEAYKTGDYKPKGKVKQAEKDWYEDYNEMYNYVYGGYPISEEDMQGYKKKLDEALEHTSPFSFSASPTDGWTLWLGPQQQALLENHTQNVAFTITRQWWQMFGTGASRVDTQVFDEHSQLLAIKEKFSRRGRLFKRYPLPQKEFKFFNNINDAPTYTV